MTILLTIGIHGYCSVIIVLLYCITYFILNNFCIKKFVTAGKFMTGGAEEEIREGF